MNSTFSPSNNIVTAAQMQAIESRLFDAGIPVAALMEKVGQLLTNEIIQLFPQAEYPTVSLLVGPGHNGGDALVMARELFERGCHVKLYQPISKSKPLTQAHWNYAKHLGITPLKDLEEWLDADVLIDGLFGFGLERPLTGVVAALIDRINQAQKPIISIDIPSGLHTDTGAVLGHAIRATHTLCLGLWKRVFFQEQALDYLGQSQLISFGIPNFDQAAVLGKKPIQAVSPPDFDSFLQRSPSTYKYKVGVTLLICGSATYPGAAILAAQAARATGIGMLYVAVPASIRDLVISQVPDAVVIACPETPSGAIAHLPIDFSLHKITAIAIGPGLTLDAASVVSQSLNWDLPLIIDADGLNLLAQMDWRSQLKKRQSTTILTPHWGEFQRLFPDLLSQPGSQQSDRIQIVSELDTAESVILVLKGARTLIKGQKLVINRSSTPALARGGSGDILTGILAGLLAQQPNSAESTATASVWWHAHAARLAQQNHTVAGVSPTALIQALLPTLKKNAKKVYEVQSP